MKQATRQPAGDKGTADRIGADEGHFWVRLVTRQALDREGLCMGHCIGDGGYDNYTGTEDLDDDAIWSLRRPDGVSVLTVEIETLSLDEAKGPKNSVPGRFESMQVAHLVAGFKEAGHALKVDEDTGIILLEDGRTFRKDRLPPDVAAAREAAAREQRAAAEAREQARRWRGPPSIPYGQVVYRPAGSTGPFRPLGDVDEFRLEIRSNERPDRPVIDRLRVSDNPARTAFAIAQELTRGEPDPVTRVTFTQDPDRGAPPLRFYLQSGREVRVSGRSLMHASIHGLSMEAALREAFLEAYRSVVGQASEPAPDAPATSIDFEVLWERDGLTVKQAPAPQADIPSGSIHIDLVALEDAVTSGRISISEFRRRRDRLLGQNWRQVHFRRMANGTAVAVRGLFG